VNPMEQFEVKPWFTQHPLFSIGGHPIFFTNQAFFMIAVVIAASLFLTFAMSRRNLVPGRMQSMAEMSYEFVSTMLHDTAGKDGLVFFPFVFTLFIFVLVSNFFGLIPGTFNITGQICITFALAAVVILMVIVTGFLKHGFGFLKLFVPHAPWWILILLVPIEVMSFFIRPMSLSVRLFANMLAGHTMLGVFAGFVIMLGGAGALAPLAVGPMLLIFAITLLEILIAFLQAYVFAILTCIYLNEALHLHDHH
jgi:F-type H+-transporting ATPase subunit a